MVERFLNLLDYVVHLDQTMVQMAAELGSALYVLLFLIVFCETGLVVMPFLPGDSLLFAAGALTALPGSPLGPGPLIFALCIAAVMGDSLNYTIGRALGKRLLARPRRWLRHDHVHAAERFYEKHGPLAVILARFAPILRTFVPFVAGLSHMERARFLTANVVGGVVWVVVFVLAGHSFGGTELVRENFHYVTLSIIVISLVPVAVQWLRIRQQAREST